MPSVKIALFTPFSPTTGGGGVIFRSILPHLGNAQVHWFYLNNSSINIPSATRLGPRIMGGPLLKDALNTFRLFGMQSHPEVDRWVRIILEWSPDFIWINAMNEGILVGKRLLDAGITHLHASVHDDPAGLADKSTRYRTFSALMDRRNTELLQKAHSVDVVCDSMQSYYRQRIGVDSGVVFRYISDLNSRPIESTESADVGTIHIGHVGSAYSAPEVFAFLSALRKIANTDGRRFHLTNFGVSPAMTAAGREFPDIVENVGNVPEPEVIQRLQKCAFVYSMYSFNPCHRIFRETSQPTKMSTYLMAARPILAHCPKGSSTIAMLQRFMLGHVVTSMDSAPIEAAIRRILEFQVDREEVSRAAEYYCGQRNLDYLKGVFGLTAQ